MLKDLEAAEEVKLRDLKAAALLAELCEWEKKMKQQPNTTTTETKTNNKQNKTNNQKQ